MAVDTRCDECEFDEEQCEDCAAYDEEREDYTVETDAVQTLEVTAIASFNPICKVRS